LPDLAFIDLLLPDLHGTQLATLLRARSPRTTLVALTGMVSRESEQRARAAGFDHYLTKPYRLEDLEAILTAIAATGGG
jgi:CheY-like chemotaxis protein